MQKTAPDVNKSFTKRKTATVKERHPELIGTGTNPDIPDHLRKNFNSTPAIVDDFLHRIEIDDKRLTPNQCRFITKIYQAKWYETDPMIEFWTICERLSLSDSGLRRIISDLSELVPGERVYTVWDKEITVQIPTKNGIKTITKNPMYFRFDLSRLNTDLQVEYAQWIANTPEATPSVASLLVETGTPEATPSVASPLVETGTPEQSTGESDSQCAPTHVPLCSNITEKKTEKKQLAKQADEFLSFKVKEALHAAYRRRGIDFSVSEHKHVTEENCIEKLIKCAKGIRELADPEPASDTELISIIIGGWDRFFEEGFWGKDNFPLAAFACEKQSDSFISPYVRDSLSGSPRPKPEEIDFHSDEVKAAMAEVLHEPGMQELWDKKGRECPEIIEALKRKLRSDNQPESEPQQPESKPKEPLISFLRWMDINEETYLYSTLAQKFQKSVPDSAKDDTYSVLKKLWVKRCQFANDAEFQSMTEEYPSFDYDEFEKFSKNDSYYGSFLSSIYPFSRR